MIDALIRQIPKGSNNESNWKLNVAQYDT